jgi:murein DD-endopeptidase MepM/ murein hydrolase activator NlpD
VTPTPTPVQTAATPSVVVASPTPALSAAAQVSAPAAKAAAAARTGESEFQTLQRQLSDLEGKVAQLTAENQRQMERLTLVTNGAIADMEQLFNALRLELRSSPTDAAPPPSTLRRRSSTPAPHHARPPSGQGGPFQPLPPQARRIERAPADPAEPLLPDLQTLFMLHQIVRALPLTPPLEEAVVTGPFGYRRDPFNRRSAFHDGIDLQAPMRSPVHATAAGTVVVAGMRPAYGRVIEVDHGFGIRTRYAHLAAIAVKEGDRIERHTLLGQLGSSGRSASPHLHYEVLFNGRPHDPADLLVLAEGIRSLR